MVEVGRMVEMVEKAVEEETAEVEVATGEAENLEETLEVVVGKMAMVD